MILVIELLQEPIQRCISNIASNYNMLTRLTFVRTPVLGRMLHKLGKFASLTRHYHNYTDNKYSYKRSSPVGRRCHISIPYSCNSNDHKVKCVIKSQFFFVWEGNSKFFSLLQNMYDSCADKNKS
jgi:hypothetical protein